MTLLYVMHRLYRKIKKVVYYYGFERRTRTKNKYLLATEEFEGIQIVKLTSYNIARVEVMIDRFWIC